MTSLTIPASPSDFFLFLSSKLGWFYFTKYKLVSHLNHRAPDQNKAFNEND